MKDVQREILNQVATGQISASEGAARLEALAQEPPPAPSAPELASPVPPAGGRVKVVSHFGSLSIVGDPTVAFATADGVHHARQDGDTMVIEQGPLTTDEGFSFGGTARWLNGFGRAAEGLTVRMNPDLPLIATLRAGDVRVVGVHGPITAEVTAGDCKLDDFRNTVNATVQAGSFKASGRLDGGASKIRCQMGDVKLSLARGSSVRISARTTMGDVSIDGEGVSPGGTGREVKVGSGAGTLQLECTMGEIKVSVD